MHFKYRFKKNELLGFLAICLSAVFFNNCGANFSTKGSAEDGLSSQSAACNSGIADQAPNTIDQALELINRLPKPLSIACFVSTLRKPLQIYAVDNVFSAQPSAGSDNPRVFIFSGNLIISVVPKGPGRDMMEFSELTTSSLSVKGEVAFPVLAELPASEPYSRIMDKAKTGTTCRGCHGHENREPSFTAGEAFSSAIIKPSPIQRVTQPVLRYLAERCNAKEDPVRCQILESIFISGSAQDQEFPSGPQ